MLMELNDWIDKYIKDEHTKEVYGKWAEKIEKDKLIEQGIELRNYEIAKNLLKLNTPLENIHLATGLTIEEIKELQNKSANN